MPHAAFESLECKGTGRGVSRRASKLVKQTAKPAEIAPGPSLVPPIGNATLHVLSLCDAPNVDERLQVFANLKDHKAACRVGVFLAEGPETIKMLLANTWNIGVTSLLLKPSCYDAIRESINALPPQSPPLQIYILSASQIAQLVGLETSRGSIACGPCPLPTERSIDWLLSRVLLPKRKWRLLAIDGSNNTANLGSMLRSASAFGVHAVLLSEDTVDQWFRQCVRVSMGHVFHVPIVRVANLVAVLCCGHRSGCTATGPSDWRRAALVLRAR
jgi:tRNA G18 (ribose-2'-O)-methylase SpoU